MKVLPDMSGLLVKVNVNRLPLDPTLFKNKNEIVVWTKFGQARAIKPNNIKFTGSIEECSSITNPELKPEKNAYVVNNSAGTNEFIVHVTSKIPDAMQSCQVIVQMIPRNESLPREIIASSDTERFGTSSYKGAINLNKSNSHIGQDAEIFRVGLRCQFSEISNPKPIWSIINAVLYPDAASKKIKITKNKVTKLSSNEIELTLPNKFNLAYPGFLKTGKFKLTVIKHPEVTISGDLPASAASEKKVNLSLGFTKGDSEKDKAFNKAWCDENLNATLSIPSIENVDIPTIKDAAIKLIKKTEGCI
ncbi:MAG: hypothetical protein L3J75_05935 [Methylococcaceae bacterium]|nr:hypothetical protein [Methylococcaceae bacterium]